MEPKRKAAANVFMEQNAAPQDEDAIGTPSAMPPPPAPPGIAQASSPTAGARPSRYEPQRDQQRQSARARVPSSGLKTSEELQLEKEPLRVRETGYWFWRR